MVTVNETLIRQILDRLIRIETLVEANNARLDDVNRRIDDTKARVDVPFENLQRELRAGFRKLRYLVLGGGAVLIAVVLVTNFLG